MMTTTTRVDTQGAPPSAGGGYLKGWRAGRIEGRSEAAGHVHAKLRAWRRGHHSDECECSICLTVTTIAAALTLPRPPEAR